MSIWKRLFGELTPIEELYEAQGRLEKVGMTFLFRNLVQDIHDVTESKLRRTVVEDILLKGEKATSVNQRLIWVASGWNVKEIGYQPEGNGRYIMGGDEIVFEVAYNKSKYKYIRQAESYFSGGVINTKILHTHEVVIDALCAALYGLEDRKRFSTYELLGRHVAKVISNGGLNKSAYWSEVHTTFGEEYITGYPFGHMIRFAPRRDPIEEHNLVCYRGEPLRGPIEEHDLIYLCPFAADVRYGVTVFVTKDGFNMGRRAA